MKISDPETSTHQNFMLFHVSQGFCCGWRCSFVQSSGAASKRFSTWTGVCLKQFRTCCNAHHLFGIVWFMANRFMMLTLHNQPYFQKVLILNWFGFDEFSKVILCYDILFLIWNKREDTSADFANLLVASPFTQPFVSSGAECMPLMKSHEKMYAYYIYI